MKTTSLKFLSLMVLLASTLILSSCGEDIEHNILVTLHNNSSGPVHLWTHNESIDASNKVESGASRTTQVPWIQRDGEVFVEVVTVKVFAGSGGETLTSKTFQVNVKETSVLNVSYTGGFSAQ